MWKKEECEWKKEKKGRELKLFSFSPFFLITSDILPLPCIRRNRKQKNTNTLLLSGFFCFLLQGTRSQIRRLCALIQSRTFFSHNPHACLSSVVLFCLLFFLFVECIEDEYLRRSVPFPCLLYFPLRPFIFVTPYLLMIISSDWQEKNLKHVAFQRSNCWKWKRGRRVTQPTMSWITASDHFLGTASPSNDPLEKLILCLSHFTLSRG